MRQKQLTEVTDWGKTNQLRNLESLRAYVQTGNWFLIVPCSDSGMVLGVRKMSRADAIFGCWVGFGSNRTTHEDFVAVTAESRREHDLLELLESILQKFRTPLLYGNGSELNLVSVLERVPTAKEQSAVQAPCGTESPLNHLHRLRVATGDRNQPLRSRKKQWAGKVEELEQAYAAIQGYPCFAFQGEYDTSVGRAMLEHAKKTKRSFWKFW